MFVSKKKHNEVVEYANRLEAALAELTEEVDVLTSRADVKEAEAEEVKQALESITNSGKAVVSLHIADDVLTVTPVVSYPETIVEKLIEAGYLNDATSSDKFAVQVSLMAAAHDALSQIMEGFTEEISEV